ncbi:MAG: multidrug transporter [Bacteroidia bacterium 44-10]|nr:MAG: multidrug transporter [Bacteroidia bacterium 44-10]
MKKIILLAMLAAIMCSCSIHTKYQRSENLSVSEAYRDMDAMEQDTTTIGSLSWRELFTDPYLQSLIETGLEHNTDLQIAFLRVEQAEAVLKSSRLAYLPSVNLAPQGALSSFDGSTPSKTYSLAASASWEIDLSGKLSNTERSNRAILESSNAYCQAVQTQLIATIANSYYTLLRLDRQLEINLATLKNWEENINTLQTLKRAGQSNDPAILRAEANRLSLESSILAVRKSINETENSLLVLLGSEAQSVERGVLAGQMFPETMAIGVPLQLLANRPDVRQAEYNVAQTHYATNVARAAFYPSITLSGSAGWTNNPGSAIVNPGEFLWSAAASLFQPIFNKGVNQANLKVAKAQAEEAALQFQQSILNAGKEVNNALVQWQTAQQQIYLGDQQIETLQEAMRKIELLMRYSSTNYLEVLTAQQSLLQAEQSQAQNQFDKIQGIINLYHAVGGGTQ